ncbi:MAG: DNA polymerase III subunit gamma/tau [Candidatus Cryptobacteroides sp.]|jgi:DNA polymerase-3 subunit gamma/tau
MSDYIVSARKYRPDSFGALLGQDNIARTLKNSIKRGQLAHAYLFCGPRGVGKTSTARIFAKTINCSNPGPDLDPCGECESCQAFEEGRSYNIHELDAASNNSVDDIRTLLEQVQIPPQVGRYSVYIIDEVHMLSAQAFNAFLKTLEEPPAHAVFILCTTEKHKIIPTILSRCQTYDFNRISIPDMMKNLREIAAKEGVKIDDESLHVIAQKADGAMRDALTLFDQTVAFCGTDVKYADVIRNLGVLDYEYSFSLADAFLAGDYAKSLLLFDEILNKGFNALHFLGALSNHLRDLLVAGTGGLDALLDQADSLKPRYLEQAKRCSVKFLYDALGIIGECEAGYKQSSNQRLHIEYALMKLSFLVKMPSAFAAAPAAPESPASVAEATSVAEAAPVPPSATPASVPAVTEAPASASATKPSPASPGKSAASPAPSAPTEPEKPAPATHASEAPAKAPTPTPAPEAPAPAETSEESSPASTPAPAPEAPASAETAPAEPNQKPAPRPRRRGVASAPVVSLINPDELKADETPAIFSEQEDRIPEDGEIIGRWSELVEKVSDRPRLATTLSGASLSISSQNGFKLLTFEVINQSQKGWIEEKVLRDLELEYNSMLGTKKLHLAVSVRPAGEVEQKIYMPEEKAQDLMEKNPEVKNFVKELALDIK